VLVLDTNVYIDATERPDRREWLARALEESSESIGLSSVVASELLLGVTESHRRAELIRRIAGEVDAILTPTHDDWITAAAAMRALGGHAGTKRRSFWNDVLIASSCARVRATLLTANTGDFKRIRALIPVETVAAFS
jgi:predicted nucleic acid-binding protein